MNTLSRQTLVALVGAELEENLALRYIRAALEQAGHPVVQIDFNSAADTEAAARALADSGAALAGFSMVFTYRAREFAALAIRARELGFAGHLVAGGHFAAFHAEALLRDNPAFDSIAIGEGEELMQALAADTATPAAVPGLVWRAADGRIIRNGAAVKPSDLDVLPLPRRRMPPDGYLGLPIANMLASRGCGFACAFCSIAAWHKLCGGERVRLRTPAAVADEMAGLWRAGYRIFNFHDDNFLLRDREATRERVRALGRELRRRGVGRMAFAIKARPGSVDEALCAELKELGLFRVFLGIEAGTPESLRRLGRRQTVAENERALEILNGLDIHTCFNLLLLNPDSTLGDFQGNLHFLRRHAGNPLNYCRTEIYTGTPLEAKLRRAGRLRGDYWGYDYEIADPRAQEAFVLMHRTLFPRHHGLQNVHHMTMRVDYERQLLHHFFGAPECLRKRAKAFIAAVNQGSAAFLEEIAEAAGRGFSAEAAREAFRRGLAARALALNARQMTEGYAILDEIRRAAATARRPAETGRKPRAALRLAASVAFVAESAMVLAGCGKKENENRETHVCEMIAESWSPSCVNPFGELENEELTRKLCAPQIAGFLERGYLPAQPVDLVLENKAGTSIRVYRPGQRTMELDIPDRSKENMLCILTNSPTLGEQDWFAGRSIRDARICLRITQEMLEQARRP